MIFLYKLINKKLLTKTNERHENNLKHILILSIVLNWYLNDKLCIWVKRRTLTYTVSPTESHLVVWSSRRSCSGCRRRSQSTQGGTGRRWSRGRTRTPHPVCCSTPPCRSHTSCHSPAQTSPAVGNVLTVHYTCIHNFWLLTTTYSHCRRYVLQYLKTLRSEQNCITV